MCPSPLLRGIFKRTESQKRLCCRDWEILRRDSAPTAGGIAPMWTGKDA